MKNSETTSAPSGVWNLPDMETIWRNPNPDKGRGPDQWERWKDNVRKIFTLATRHKWTKREMAQKIGMSEGTFSQYFSGKYDNGRYDKHNDTVEAYLKVQADILAQASKRPVAPSYMETRASKVFEDTLSAAHVMGKLVMITGASGIGKTTTCEHYRSTRSNVVMATMNEETRSVHAMLKEIAAEMKISPYGKEGVTRLVGQALSRRGDGTLLIVDEAQHLTDQSINQLRHFVDRYECGVAIVGNTATHTRFSTNEMKGDREAQVRRRFFMRRTALTPDRQDLVRYIEAWGIYGKEEQQLLVGIAMKGGAFGQIAETVSLAQIYQTGEDAPIDVATLRYAWQNRDVEAVSCLA